MKKAIEHFILKKTELRETLMHFVTFIIDNPVKKGAEQFIAQCRDASVPVFVATGDTTKAAENIAKVLCPQYAKKIHTFRAEDVNEHSLDLDEVHSDSTVIFSGINEAILVAFQKLMDRELSQRPVIIFA